MKYGLAGAKKHTSLRCLPIYMDPALQAKYVPLLPFAVFQKGCINFSDAAAMPIEVVKAFITECSAIDIPKMLENRKKKSK